MPAPQMTSPTTRPFAAPTQEPRLSYAIDDQHDASRSKCAKPKPNGDLGRQHTVTLGLSRGRPQWVRRVRRSSASSEGFVSLATASALGPPRLHDPTGSLCLAPPNAGLFQPPVRPLAPVASPVLQITAPDNDASATAEPLGNTLLSNSHFDLEQAAPSRRQSLTNLSLYTNSRQAPTPRVVTAASNVLITPWQQY